ncbi:hypothetical protein ACJ73_08806 [Blastomyces percursus]|uniref:Uncharacterized protein n=1 Tax=Blastomyces percursus TaxID=1658174 RepID=A0A1J9PLN8_9EURO|nr:hypothetical protein ACJ73_08806 [Blastomyces percursus]
MSLNAFLYIPKCPAPPIAVASRRLPNKSRVVNSVEDKIPPSTATPFTPANRLFMALSPVGAYVEQFLKHSRNRFILSQPSPFRKNSRLYIVKQISAKLDSLCRLQITPRTQAKLKLYSGDEDQCSRGTGWMIQVCHVSIDLNGSS